MKKAVLQWPRISSKYTFHQKYIFKKLKISPQAQKSLIDLDILKLDKEKW